MKDFDCVYPDVLRNLLLRPDAVHEIRKIQSVLNQNGIAVRVKSDSIFFADREELFCGVDALALNLALFSEMLNDKLSASEHLLDLGFDGIKRIADYGGVVTSFMLKSREDGEWCRYDDIVFVRYAGLIDTTRAHDLESGAPDRTLDEHFARLALKTLSVERDACSLAA